MPCQTGFSDLGSKKIGHFKNNGTDDPFVLAAALPGISQESAKKIRLTSLTITSDGAGTVVFQSAATEIGRITFKANDPPVVLPWNPDGWMETNNNEALNLQNDSALTLEFFGTYAEV